jgi:hypothetical protein
MWAEFDNIVHREDTRRAIDTIVPMLIWHQYSDVILVENFQQDDISLADIRIIDSDPSLRLSRLQFHCSSPGLFSEV